MPDLEARQRISALETEIGTLEALVNELGNRLAMIGLLTPGGEIIQPSVIDFYPPIDMRLGNGLLPEFGFSGLRFAYPPVEYGGEEWHLAGVQDDVLQAGIRASDGVIVAGGGEVRLDDTGVVIGQGTGAVNRVKWVDGANSIGYIYCAGSFGVQSQVLVRAVGGGTQGTVLLQADRLSGANARYSRWLMQSAASSYRARLYAERISDKTVIDFMAVYDDEVIFNEGGHDIDYRFHGENVDDVLMIDASTDKAYYLGTEISVASVDAQYVTLAVDATLSTERVLTGTANQVIITDNGAGSTVVLSTPQDIHAGASPTFAGLTLEGNQVIDNTATEALLVRKDADAQDVFTVDTTNSKIILSDSDGSVDIQSQYSGRFIVTPDSNIMEFIHASGIALSFRSTHGTTLATMVHDTSNYSFQNDVGGLTFTNLEAGASGFLQLRTSNTIRLHILYTGDIIIGGGTVPSAKLHIDQTSSTGAKPVLLLDQGDVSEEFVKFVGAAAAGVLTQSVVDEGDQASETREGWLKVEVEDVGDQIADQAYYIPIYSLSA